MTATGYTGGGGGGGGTPSNTVVSETSFGQVPDDGSSITYSRGDHTHGTPAAPAGGTPSGTVVSEKVLNNAAASAGVSGDYSRGDHTHGTPPMPSAANVGADPSGSAAAALASALSADPTPGGTVVTETTFGQGSTAGVAATYSRSDHTHGTPATPTIPSAAGTVAAETSYGVVSSAGVAATFSRGDHTHGTPSLGTSGTTAAAGNDTRIVNAIQQTLIDAKGDVLAGTADNTIARLGVGANGTVLTADSAQSTGLAWVAPSGGAGRLKTVAQAPLTSGNITVANGPGFTVIGSDLTIPALAGDILAIDIEAMCANTGSDMQFEAVTRVSGANTNFWSSGNGTSLNPGGVAAWYASAGFVGPRGRSYYTVQAGDVVSGNVTVRILGFGAGGARVVQANTSYPFRWYLSNVGT